MASTGGAVGADHEHPSKIAGFGSDRPIDQRHLAQIKEERTHQPQQSELKEFLRLLSKGMKFTETKLAGVCVIKPQRFEDERGFFAPAFSAEEFAARGMASVFVQNNISYSKRGGTLRGMHYQAAPYSQAKLIRCTRGAVYDVAVDMRPDSPTFRQWIAFELTAQNRSMVYLPGDCAHGFQTLTDDTEIFYMVLHPYVPESGGLSLE